MIEIGFIDRDRFAPDASRGLLPLAPTPSAASLDRVSLTACFPFGMRPRHGACASLPRDHVVCVSPCSCRVLVRCGVVSCSSSSVPLLRVGWIEGRADDSGNMTRGQRDSARSRGRDESTKRRTAEEQGSERRTVSHAPLLCLSAARPQQMVTAGSKHAQRQ